MGSLKSLARMAELLLAKGYNVHGIMRRTSRECAGLRAWRDMSRR